MKENLNLVEILKDCPKGTKLYSTVLGEVEFDHANSLNSYPIGIKTEGRYEYLTTDGKLLIDCDGECTLFPSREQRDWSKFTAPWYNPEKHGKEEYGLKSSKDEDVRKFMQYIKKQAKAYEFNLPNRDYDIYAFAKDLLVWLENQDEDKKETNNFDVLPGLYKCVHRMFDGTPDGRLLFEIGNVYKCLSKHDRAEFEVSYGHSVYLEDPVVCKYFIPFENKVEQASSQINERAWLYLVSDVLTWKDGIGQYLDDTRVQELAKRLCSEYAQKLYNPSNTGKNEQKSADKIEPRFKVGDWVVRGDTIAQIVDIQEQYYVGLDINGKDFVSSRFLNSDKIHLWTIQDAKDGDVLCCKSGWMCIFKSLNNHTNTFSSYCFIDSYKYFFNSGSECHTLDKEFINAYNGEIHPATKEQHDTFMKAMNDAGYKWDAEKKKLKKLVTNRFDPNTLQPFDKVLVKDFDETSYWTCNLFSHYNKNKGYYYCSSAPFDVCIPYNDDTKHLLGTYNEAPEYYRYWED